MSKRICDILFLILCICLIFLNIPPIIQMNTLGAVVGNKLVFYPLFVSLVYTFYCEYKYKNILINFAKFKKYILLFLGINLLSTIIGLYMYPYYDLILHGPVDQIEKLPKVLVLLNDWGIDIQEQSLIMLWIVVRVLKTVCLETLYTFGGAYIIYCWYYNRVKDGYTLLLKAIIISIIIILFYSFIEIFYLLGNDFATNILIFVNPILHEIKFLGTWWPPLLWQGQLRSIFTEPSYYGIYAAFAMPLLWYAFIKAKNLKYKISIGMLMFGFVFCLFLTKARTAVALFGGECVLLILFMLYLRKKIFIQKVICILLCSGIAFLGANIVIGNMPVNKKAETTNKINVEAYLEDNLGSLASTDKRSNTARYSAMIANFKIGVDYPILGVGTNLANAYITEYLPDMSKNNAEVNMWLKNQQEMGILKSGFPTLGEYTCRFAQNGLLGLMVFLAPAFILFRKLLQKIYVEKNNYEIVLPYVFFTISFIGIMTAGIGDYINVTYCYWVLLGLGYAMCFGKSSIK